MYLRLKKTFLLGSDVLKSIRKPLQNFSPFFLGIDKMLHKVCQSGSSFFSFKFLGVEYFSFNLDKFFLEINVAFL